MILLIDANILLDVLMNRQDFVKDSSMIWKLCETNQAKGYISVLTIANLMYIMRKQLDPETIEKLLAVHQHIQKNICINQQNHTFPSTFPVLHHPDRNPLLKCR